MQVKVYVSRAADVVEKGIVAVSIWRFHGHIKGNDHSFSRIQSAIYM